MALDNSTIQHPLPGDLQARVENALNLITSLEAEEVRLRKMIGTSTQRINDLHEEEKATEARIKTLKGNIPDLEKDVEISKGIMNELESRKVLVNNELAQATDQLQTINNEIESKKIDIAQREKNIGEWESHINTKKAELESKEFAHNKKVERLLEAIK